MVRNGDERAMPELYMDDPKAVLDLDGVAVAGLVGILSQLSDLVEFAAEVFRGLQEQVLVTSSRSHKMGERVYNIEAAIPPLEKAILAQRTHLHFSYTAGSNWHAQSRIEQNHFIYSDLPQCITNSYEDCRVPPCLHKLDKFDADGRGSCFKRYSDPTYFKRISAGSYGTHLQSVPKEKKARRSKKRRSSSRRRDVTLTLEDPTFKHGNRMDFVSSSFGRKSFPSQNISTVHATQKSGTDPDMQDHLTLIDSRTGSEHIECIFHPSYSTQCEQNEARKLSSDNDSNVQHIVYLDSYSLDKNNGVPDENTQNSCLEGPRSSFVTWDEKLEIVESTGLLIDTTEISCIADELDTEEKEDLSSIIDHLDFDFCDEHVPTLVIVGGQPDQIKSETDYHLDALNIIESESGTDLYCQMKRELKQYSSVNNKDVEGNLDNGSTKRELKQYSREAMSCPSPESVSPEPHMEAYGFSNNGTSVDKSESDTSEKSDLATSPQMVVTSLISLTSIDDFESEKCEILGMNMETVCSDGLFSSSREPNSQPTPSKQILSTDESPGPILSITGVHTTLTNPIMFWTNGGLLGLEPSKPPVFSLPSTSELDLLAKNNDDDGPVARMDMVGNNSKPESSQTFPSNAQERDCNAFGIMTSGIDVPATRDDHAKSIKENGISSTPIFEFTYRLLENGSRGQISLVGDELTSSMRTDVPEKISVMGKPFAEQFGSRSPLKTPFSPPLQRMSISFQPIGGFETSKLKLKFPDGSNCHERSGDMFTSFQLVPEPTISLHGSGSDSDDDTFCRSSLYASDDCHSHHSESDSEQWDSSDSPRSKDHELDDAICRFSLAESVSSSQQPKPASLKQDHFVGIIDQSPNHKQPEQKNLSVQNEASHTTCTEVINEKQDLLQHIRTKAVGSDVREDDNWRESILEFHSR